jgi:hypothetical protein
MELIAANRRINAKPAVALTALTTTDGVRLWWTDEADVGCDIGRSSGRPRRSRSWKNLPDFVHVFQGHKD